MCLPLLFWKMRSEWQGTPWPEMVFQAERWRMVCALWSNSGWICKGTVPITLNSRFQLFSGTKTVLRMLIACPDWFSRFFQTLTGCQALQLKTHLMEDWKSGEGITNLIRMLNAKCVHSSSLLLYLICANAFAGRTESFARLHPFQIDLVQWLPFHYFLQMNLCNSFFIGWRKKSPVC